MMITRLNLTSRTDFRNEKGKVDKMTEHLALLYKYYFIHQNIVEIIFNIGLILDYMLMG